MTIQKLNIYYEASYKEKDATKEFVLNIITEFAGGGKTKAEPIDKKAASDIIEKAERIKDMRYRTVTQ
jgi:hypothetical protein